MVEKLQCTVELPASTVRGSFFVVVVVVVFCFLFFRDRFSQYSPGCPETHSLYHAGLELRNPPASASGVLELKVCATTPGLNIFQKALEIETQGRALGKDKNVII